MNTGVPYAKQHFNHLYLRNFFFQEYKSSSEDKQRVMEMLARLEDENAENGLPEEEGEEEEEELADRIQGKGGGQSGRRVGG